VRNTQEHDALNDTKSNLDNTNINKESPPIFASQSKCMKKIKGSDDIESLLKQSSNFSLNQKLKLKNTNEDKEENSLFHLSKEYVSFIFNQSPSKIDVERLQLVNSNLVGKRMAEKIKGSDLVRDVKNQANNKSLKDFKLKNENVYLTE